MRLFFLMQCLLMSWWASAGAFSGDALAPVLPLALCPIPSSGRNAYYSCGVMDMMQSSHAEQKTHVLKDGEHMFSLDYFRTALRSVVRSRRPYILFYAASVSRGAFPFQKAGLGQSVVQAYHDYTLQEYGDDGIVIAYDIRTGLSTVLGYIERGKELLCGSDAIELFRATSLVSFPYISWDMVVYSYAAAILAVKARAMIDQRDIPCSIAVYASGCGIGYGLVMRMGEAPNGALLQNQDWCALN